MERVNPAVAAAQRIRDSIRDAVLKVAPLDPDTERRARSLTSLNRPGLSPWNGPKHVYAGTVPRREKLRRRARNKRARLSRRANRR